MTITLLFALTSCVTNLPEYISSTPAEKIPEMIALFNKEQDNIAVEYTGAYNLPIKPENYYEQNVPYCGGFSIAGILSAYHMDVDEPISSHMSSLGRLFGGMSPAAVLNFLEIGLVHFISLHL